MYVKMFIVLHTNLGRYRGTYYRYSTRSIAVHVRYCMCMYFSHTTSLVTQFQILTFVCFEDNLLYDVLLFSCMSTFELLSFFLTSKARMKARSPTAATPPTAPPTIRPVFPPSLSEKDNKIKLFS